MPERLLNRQLVLVTASDPVDSDFTDPVDSDFTDGMRRQVAELTDWFSANGLPGGRAFTVVEHKLTTRDDAKAALEHVQAAGEDDVAFLFISGHGVRPSSGRHFLCMPDANERAQPDQHHVLTAGLVMPLVRSGARHAVVVVNSCFGNSVLEQIRSEAKDLSHERRDLDTLAVITIGDFDDRPRILEFSQLLGGARDRLREKSGITTENLSIGDFLRELTLVANASRLELLRPNKVYPNHDCLSECLALPNPGFRSVVQITRPEVAEVATRPADLDYWLDRASGRTAADDPGWYFSGREHLSVRIADFLRGEAGSLIVTGVAGSGKSAVLARAVTLSDPNFLAHERYSAAVSTIRERAPQTLPPESSIDVAVLARNLGALDLLRDLGRRIVAGAAESAPSGSVHLILQDLDDPKLTAQDIRSRIVRALGRAPGVTVVLDGLDEANDPERVISEVIAPLVRHTTPHGRRPFRFIVGVRSSGPGSGDDTLLSQVHAVLPDVGEVRTDGDDARPDIVDYVRAVLSVPGTGATSPDASPGDAPQAEEVNPYADEPDARDVVAHVIADAVAPSFLDARLAAHQLRTSATLQDPHNHEWRSTLAAGTVGLLREDLRQALAADPTLDSEHVVAVLRATAFALGRGLPWAEVWAVVASAVHGAPISHADEVIRFVLGGRLSGYLTQAIEDERRVYRPVHARLAEVLRAQSFWDLASEGKDGPADPAPHEGSDGEMHAQIARALAELVAISTSEGLAPHPYPRRRLVEHAARGGCLTDEIVTEQFLPWETSGTVRAHLGLPLHAEGRSTGLAAWAAIEPHLDDLSAADRAAGLALARFARGLRSRPEIAIGPLHPRWAHWPTEANILAALPATCIEQFQQGDKSLLVMGCADGTVRIWDPDTGTQVGDPLTGHTSWVRGVVGFPGPGGATRLATTSGEGTVRIWDPDTGTQVGDPLTGHTGGVDGVVGFPGPDGATRLATTSDDGTVRIWDPDTGTQVGDPLTGHTRGVTGVVVFPGPGGATRLATTSGDGTVRIWDPDTGTQVGAPLTGHTSGVDGVVGFPGPDGAIRLATTSWDGTVRIWDPDTGTQLQCVATGSPVTAVGADSAGHSVFAGGPEGRLVCFDVVEPTL
ncbi:MAG: AAA family ATPase [Actinomycetales bacterium]